MIDAHPKGPADRRQHARHRCPEDLHLTVFGVLDVELVDISSTGVLFRSACAFPEGERLELQTVLAGEPFAAVVEVRRSQQVPGSGVRPYRIAASFASIGRDTARRLQGLLDV